MHTSKQELLLSQVVRNLRFKQQSAITELIREISTNSAITELIREISKYGNANVLSLVACEETRAKIAKFAAVNRAAPARRYLKSHLRDLPESTVRKYKNMYKREASLRLKNDDSRDINALPLQKRGRPLALGEELDSDVKKYLTALRQAGTSVGVSLVLSAAESIIASKDTSLLVENGDHISLTRGWALSIFKRMGYVKRKATTKINT